MDFNRSTAVLTLLLFSVIVSGCKDESLVQIINSDLEVGVETTVKIKITAPEGGIAVGGNILFPFYMKPWNGLIKGVSEDKKSNSLVIVTRSDGGKIEVENVLTNPQWDILSDLKVLIQDTPLPGGESLEIQFGTEEMKVVVGRKQLSLFIEMELDAEGNGAYVKLKPPQLSVAESEPVKLCLVAPDHVKIGESFEVVVYAEDVKINVCEKYEGSLDIFVLGNEGGDHITYKMRQWDQRKDLDRNCFNHIFNDPGIYYLKAVDEDRGLTAISNPVIVSSELPEKKLFWGEIHVHSQISDGRGELQDVYRDGYARGLDFIAITDHSFGRDDRGTLEERINDLCKEADRFNRPGKFVAIPAGETHYLPVMHMNMYFNKADPGNILELVHTVREATTDLGRKWENLTSDQLADAIVPYWDVFKSEAYHNNTLVFPHHTMWLGIKPFIDPERTRVIEVHSVHGTSEIRDQANTPKPLRMKANRIMKGDQDRKFSVREILNDGVRLGFAGGSDSHEGQAGYNAITGVFCDELTRSSIIRGMYKKDCYATSSNRTLIDTEPVGDKYVCHVAGDGEIDVVRVIYNGEVVSEPTFEGRICKFDWTPHGTEGYFYIKVILEDGEEAAWSSPVWLD